MLYFVFIFFSVENSCEIRKDVHVILMRKYGLLHFLVDLVYRPTQPMQSRIVSDGIVCVQSSWLYG